MTRSRSGSRQRRKPEVVNSVHYLHVPTLTPLATIEQIEVLRPGDARPKRKSGNVRNGAIHMKPLPVSFKLAHRSQHPCVNRMPGRPGNMGDSLPLRHRWRTLR